MLHIETLLLTFSSLIIISIIIARLSNNIGVPILLLFIGVGMLAGSEGPGGIYFDDAKLAQTIGVISLVLILFSGGLDTHWNVVKPVLWPSLSLATIGVVVTTVAVGLFTHYVFGISMTVSFLLGAIVASTDAAAVFSIIGGRNLKIKGRITPLLELESGTNDPMAVFLTISMIEIITANETSYWILALNFFKEMGVGLAMGVGLGRLMVIMINRLKFPIEGLYPVFALAGAFFVYSTTTIMHGSGFLAVYLAGMMLSKYDIVFKKNIFRFFDGMAWMSQIVMFVTLGLLVFPSQILPTIKSELFISLFLILVARPLGVFLSLVPFNFKFREKLFISWAGLRGAVPIILATFPLIEGIKEAQWIFNVVFFIVLTSALLQGWSIPWVAKLLRLNSNKRKSITTSLEFSHLDRANRTIIKLIVPDSEMFNGKSLVEIKELKGCLIVSIRRGDRYFVPSGSTLLEPGDELQALADHQKFKELEKILIAQDASLDPEAH